MPFQIPLALTLVLSYPQEVVLGGKERRGEQGRKELSGAMV